MRATTTTCRVSGVASCGVARGGCASTSSAAIGASSATTTTAALPRRLVSSVSSFATGGLPILSSSSGCRQGRFRSSATRPGASCTGIEEGNDDRFAKKKEKQALASRAREQIGLIDDKSKKRASQSPIRKSAPVRRKKCSSSKLTVPIENHLISRSRLWGRLEIRGVI